MKKQEKNEQNFRKFPGKNLKGFTFTRIFGCIIMALKQIVSTIFSIDNFNVAIIMFLYSFFHLHFCHGIS